MNSQSENINELATALSKAQGEMSAPELNKKGYNYSYADLNSVWSVCRKPLTNHGLSIIQMGRIIDSKSYLATRLCHVSGQWIESYFSIPEPKPSLDKKGKHGEMQDLGAFITYLKRYAITAMLGIHGDEDTDCSPPESDKKTYQSDNQSDNQNDRRAAKKEPEVEFATEAQVKEMRDWIKKVPENIRLNYNKIIEKHGVTSDFDVPIKLPKMIIDMAQSYLKLNKKAEEPEELPF